MRHSIRRMQICPSGHLARPSRAPFARTYTSFNNESSNHHDLTSFLSYASRTGLSPTSTTYVGTHYEYTVMQSLSRLGFKLSRTGGRLDGGIDLLGTWNVPTLPTTAPLHILLQCKALNRKAGPNLIRELEGTFVGAPAAWKKAATAILQEAEPQGGSDGNPEVDRSSQLEAADPTLGSSGIMALLIASKEATKGVRDAMGRSRWPMGYAKITLNGNVEQLLWNKSAASRGLHGLGIATRFKPKSMKNSPKDGDIQLTTEEKVVDEETPVTQEIVLTWNGQIWETVFPDNQSRA